MCIKINMSGSYTILRKEKLNGNVEVISIAPWDKTSLVKSLQNIVSLSPASIKTNGYLIKYQKNSKYVSIKDLKNKTTIFIPIYELGSVITRLG